MTLFDGVTYIRFIKKWLNTRGLNAHTKGGGGAENDVY